MSTTHPADRTDKLPVAFDLDGTLAEETWTPENLSREIGKPIPGALERVKEVFDAGWQCVIHTSRPWSDLPNIALWLDMHGYMSFISEVYCEKLLAELYVDNKARHHKEKSWLPAN